MRILIQETTTMDKNPFLGYLQMNIYCTQQSTILTTTTIRTIATTTTTKTRQLQNLGHDSHILKTPGGQVFFQKEHQYCFFPRTQVLA